jgi:hypothetical protein
MMRDMIARIARTPETVQEAAGRPAELEVRSER